MVYWNGSTGSVTVGPDFWHFHIIFALRPNAEGCAEGQTILVTNKEQAFRLYHRQNLADSKRYCGSYFAKGDTRVFKPCAGILKPDQSGPSDHPIYETPAETKDLNLGRLGVPWGSNQEAAQGQMIEESRAAEDKDERSQW